jgi:hypothetical protein
MSISSKPSFKKNQKVLSTSQLNDIQEVAKQSRRGQNIVGRGVEITETIGETTDVFIEAVPVLYKTIGTQEIGGTTYIKGQEVDSATGNTYGPVFYFAMISL